MAAYNNGQAVGRGREKRKEKEKDGRRKDGEGGGRREVEKVGRGGRAANNQL